MATYSNYLIHKILLEAGMPPSVIQFVPGSPPEVVRQCIDHKEFGGLHFTGSTQVFRGLYKRIAGNLEVYGGYPRIVGETGECDEIRQELIVLFRREKLPSVSPDCRYPVRRDSSYPSGFRIFRSASPLDSLAVLIQLRPKMLCPIPSIRPCINVE